MSARGFVVRNPETGRYYCGPLSFTNHTPQWTDSPERFYVFRERGSAQIAAEGIIRHHGQDAEVVAQPQPEAQQAAELLLMTERAARNSMGFKEAVAAAPQRDRDALRRCVEKVAPAFSWAQRMAAAAKLHGRIHLAGEMEIPVGVTCREAYQHAAQIAEHCGYLVMFPNGCRSMLQISGGDIPGYVVLDWMDTERPGPVTVEAWTAERVWL